MARSGKTAQEFIQSSFSPIIAVLCSPKVENVTSKNNLSFTELLQPFTALDWEGQIREPGGNVCIVKNWKLIIRDVHWKPLPPTEARKQLNNAVLHNFTDKTVLLELDGKQIDVPQSTPWFDAWRETYLEVQFPSDHEYTKHFLSCIIVGTTLDDSIVDTFNTLNQQYAQLQNITPPKLPKWFNNGVLKSYLLLHDVSAVAKDKADAAFETLKQTFGSSNCFMLSINSKSTTDPSLQTDFWAPYIKRSNDSSEMLSSLSNLPTTPPDPQPFPIGAGSSDDGSVISASVPPEGMHPLTTSENDVYDNANSLQTHSFSGSSESMNVSVKPLDYSTEVHGLALNANDVEAIKKFFQEYAAKALLPYLEKQISQLSELVANRKGVSRSLLSATKRWFGTGKGGNTTGNNSVIYSSDCPELQLRRLADLWFLCGQWQRAFDTYHTAKREFYADSAWLCYAGALEMAAVSAFMAGDANKKTHGYMEESIVTYLNTCRMVQYAVRATLLSVLCLGSAGAPGEAAKQLIRMTSEDSDLRSAMLLEQASLCFLSGPGSKAMCRKYAFHMVLAGHRFSKAGQKKHAYRCYNQAYQVYRNSGWRLSTDHVQFALGRLAGALRLPRAAVRWLRAPLAPAARAPQPPAQQDAFLREYMLAHQQWVDSSEEFKEQLPVLPLPLLASEATAVLCAGPAPLASPGRLPATSLAFPPSPDRQEEQTWHKLEKMLLQVVRGSVPMIFKPTVDLYTANTDLNPVVPQGEPIQISITLRNPLKVVLVLKDVELLWQFVSEGDAQVVNNEPAVACGSSLESNAICGQKIKSVLLEGETSKTLTFSLTPLRMGQLCVQGMAYKLINAGEGGNEDTSGSIILGKLDLLSGVNASDKRLQITVIPPAPCLQMTFTESSTEALSGELRVVDVEIRNVGPVDAGPVYFAVSRPDCVQLLAPSEELFKPLYDEKYKEPTVYPDERAARAGAWRALAARHVACAAPGVRSGALARARLVLRARAPAAAPALLALYRPEPAPAPVPSPGHRLLRHVFRCAPAVSVSLAARHVACAAPGVRSGALARARLVLRARAPAAAPALLALYRPEPAPAPAPSPGHRLLRHVFRCAPAVSVSLAARHVACAAPGVRSGALARARLVLRARAPAAAPALLALYRPEPAPAPAPSPGHRLLRHVFRCAPAVSVSLAARHVACAAPGVRSGALARARLVLRARAPAAAPALLALYRPEPAPAPAPSPGHRLLRHVFRCAPAEAVEISVTPRRSIKATPDNVFENMNLVTEIKNICGEKEDDITIEVVEASLLSRQWRLTGLISAGDKQQLLHSREKMHLVFQASRIFDFPAEVKVGWSGLKIATGQPDPEDNITVSPYSYFVNDYETSIDNMETNGRTTDRKAGLVQSMFVVRWKAHHRTKGTTVDGQHYLWLEDFSKVLSRVRDIISPDAPALQLDEYDIKLDPHEKRKNKDNVVVFRLEHSNLISHNFQKSKLCLVPITINIVNCYEVPVDVFIDMSKQPNREGGRSLGWCGALSGAGTDGGELGLRVRLERWQARRVPLRAVCAAPGAYVVGSAFTVTATLPGALTLAHSPANTSLLVVQTP